MFPVRLCLLRMSEVAQIKSHQHDYLSFLLIFFLLTKIDKKEITPFINFSKIFYCIKLCMTTTLGKWR